MIDYSQLLDRGYYVGKLSEILRPEEEPELDDVIQEAWEHIKNSPEDYEYRQSVDGLGIDRYPSNLAKFRRGLKQLFESQKKEVFQQWMDINLSFSHRANRLFNTLTMRVVEHAYPDLFAKGEENIKTFPSLSLYENGDFIIPHKDGQNPGRIFVILIYLSDIKDYNNGGGRLIIADTLDYEDVMPLRGNYVLLDFTKHNVSHAVEVVKNDFRRLSFISFVYDKTEHQTLTKEKNEYKF